jgi:hypothetical protein
MLLHIFCRCFSYFTVDVDNMRVSTTGWLKLCRATVT